MQRIARWTLAPWQSLLCAAAGALIVGAGFLAVGGARDAKVAIGSVQHTSKVMLAIDELSAALGDAETGQRGYLLTGDARYLEPYQAALGKIAPARRELEALTSEAGTPPETSGRLDSLIRAKLEEMALTIERYHAQGPDSALGIVAIDIGKRTMNEIRALLAGMRGEKSRMLAERLARRDDGIRRTFLATMLVVGSSLLVFAVAIASLNRTLRRRIAAERAAGESEELLRVTLESIGDAVIATDVDGNVVFLNAVAQQLTGWRGAEAIGLALHQVFHIVDEFSREVVESPAEKVLREGVIVGLANHTVVIARDGTEHPIDASGAPIRDAGGALMGVVLVFRDISARRLADQDRIALLEAESARETAEAANRAKDEFLAVVSHELRSPLAAASSWIEVLEAANVSPAERERAIETISRNLRLQTRLIGDLLDLSRIATGKLTIVPVAMDVGAVVDGVLHDHRHTAHANGIALRFEAEPACVARVDRTRFEQLLSNLLSNAIRFTPAGGSIDVALAARDGMLELSVRDTGQGIAPDLLPHVFDRFWQSQDPTRREHAGLRLGLAIAKHLVEQHGGTIEVASDGVGRGAEFRIRLPRYEGNEVVTPRPAPARGPSRKILGGVDVLLVEDEADTRDALEYLLRSRGATVRVAGTAADALALYQHQRPTIVISDLGLPRESGIDLILRVRADDEALGIRTPAIAATGLVGGEDRRRALAAGFDAKVSKPVDFAVLLRTMLELLGRDANDR